MMAGRRNYLESILVALFTLLACSFMRGENYSIKDVVVDIAFQQQALLERKKIKKKDYKQFVSDPQLDDKAFNVLYKLYKLPAKKQTVFAVHNSYSFRDSRMYKQVGEKYMPLSVCEKPEMKNRLTEITGCTPMLNAIEMTHALDEYWELFENTGVPSGPDVNEKYYAYLLTNIKAAYELYGSIPVITYHMANPYSPVPPQRYGAYHEYKNEAHKNVVREMRARTGNNCGCRGEYITPRAYLDSKLDVFASFLKELKDKNGHPIPCIIRPFHEMDMNSFWWGVDFCSAEDFIWLFRYTVETIQKKVGTHNLIWGYSLGNKFTTIETMMERYPGDEYVDILGGDEYNIGLSLPSTKDSYIRCRLITQEGLKRHKICGLFECGMTDEALRNTTFYSEQIPTLINSDGIHFSFILGYMAMPTNAEGEKNMRSFARRRSMLKRW